jgi:hypothetical protein
MDMLGAPTTFADSVKVADLGPTVLGLKTIETVQVPRGATFVVQPFVTTNALGSAPDTLILRTVRSALPVFVTVRILAGLPSTITWSPKAKAVELNDTLVSSCELQPISHSGPSKATRHGTQATCRIGLP